MSVKCPPAKCRARRTRSAERQIEWLPHGQLIPCPIACQRRVSPIGKAASARPIGLWIRIDCGIDVTNLDVSSLHPINCATKKIFSVPDEVDNLIRNGRE